MSASWNCVRAWMAASASAARSCRGRFPARTGLLPLDVHHARVRDGARGRDALLPGGPGHRQRPADPALVPWRKNLPVGYFARANWIAALVANRPLTVRPEPSGSVFGLLGIGLVAARVDVVVAHRHRHEPERRRVGAHELISPLAVDERRSTWPPTPRTCSRPTAAVAVESKNPTPPPRMRTQSGRSPCPTSRPWCRSRTSGSPRCCTGRRGCGTGRTCTRPDLDVPTNSIWSVLPGSPTGWQPVSAARARASATARAGFMAAEHGLAEGCATRRSRRCARPRGPRCRP